MYGDPDRLIALAASIEQQADGVRTLARTMVARGDGTQWVGLAAERHRDALRDDAADYARCADRLDDAAAALRAHAAKVHEVTGLIAAAERRVTQFLHDAGTTLERGLHALEHLPWTKADAPASGSADWLTLAAHLAAHLDEHLDGHLIAAEAGLDGVA